MIVGESHSQTVEITLRVISNRKDLLSIEPDRITKITDAVHLAFRPSGKDIIALTEKFPRLQLIQMPESYSKNMAKFVEMYLAQQNIMFVVGDVWGHRKDLSTSATVKIDKGIIDAAKEKSEVAQTKE